MMAEKLRYLRGKINHGKPITIQDIVMLDEAAGYIAGLEKDIVMYQGELLSSTASIEWELKKPLEEQPK